MKEVEDSSKKNKGKRHKRNQQPDNAQYNHVVDMSNIYN